MFYLVLAHLVGDFILQTDEMALGKKTSSFVCFIHVLMYMFPFCFLGLPLWMFLLVAAQHFIQDRTNFVMWFMKWKGSERFATGPCAPWSIILTDNILHITFITVLCLANEYYHYVVYGMR